MELETAQSERNIGTLMTSVVKHVEGQAASVETAVFGQDHSRQRMPLPEDYEAKRNYEDLPKLFPQIVRIFQGVFGSYIR